MPEPKPGIYEHYKGNRYEVIGPAHHSETLEELVVYKALYKIPKYGMNTLWVRPKKMWLESVKINGRRVPRFSPINSGGIGLKPKDIFWIGIFPFILFIINYTLFVLDEAWVRRVYADDYLHLLGGASIAFSTSYIITLLERSGKLAIHNRLVKLLIIMAAVTLTAVGWEFYEFILDIIYIPINQPSVEDTIKDLVMGLWGGTVFTAIYIHLKSNKIWRKNLI